MSNENNGALTDAERAMLMTLAENIEKSDGRLHVSKTTATLIRRALLAAQPVPVEREREALQTQIDVLTALREGDHLGMQSLVKERDTLWRDLRKAEQASREFHEAAAKLVSDMMDAMLAERGWGECLSLHARVNAILTAQQARAALATDAAKGEATLSWNGFTLAGSRESVDEVYRLIRQAGRLAELEAAKGEAKPEHVALLISRLRVHGADIRNTAFSRSTMNEVADYLAAPEVTADDARDAERFVAVFDTLIADINGRPLTDEQSRIKNTLNFADCLTLEMVREKIDSARAQGGQHE